MQAKYINPFTDFSFKKIFGEIASKDILIDFLNSLLDLESPIQDLQFQDKEKLGDNEFDRKAIYDIYCENEKGEKFIVELQKAKQNYFRERTIYYSTFPIQEQAEKGNWNFNLKAIYCVGILDFIFKESEQEEPSVVHTIQLKDQKGKLFYDKLTYVYIEMPRFQKLEIELVTRLDKWLYFIQHLEDFDAIPSIFQEKVFESAFTKAEIANLGPNEFNAYEMNLKVYRDYFNTVDTAHQEGIQQGELRGIEKGIQIGMEKGEYQKALSIAKSLKENGLSIELISQTTGLSILEIEAL